MNRTAPDLHAAQGGQIQGFQPPEPSTSEHLLCARHMGGGGGALAGLGDGDRELGRGQGAIWVWLSQPASHLKPWSPPAFRPTRSTLHETT